MKQAEEYYYGRMPKDKQNTYRAMLAGLMDLSDEILLPQVPTTDGNWLYDVFFQLRLDHPEIFWAVGFKYRHYKDSPNLILIPEYIFDKSKIREHKKALHARVEKLVRPAAKFSEWDKEKYVHDFICENIRYDKLKKPYSHEIIGPLGHGVGVCEGIAKSVKILCDALGVWCVIAICGNNPEKGIKYRHTWNIVRINGQYYHLDATFDNTLGRNMDDSVSIRYDYFNLDDKNIFRDHEPLIAPAPACPDGSHSYYREKKLSFTKTEDVYKRALQAARKGREFTFHWRGSYLTREVLADLVDQIQAAGKTLDKKAIITLNWPQAILRFHFTDQQAEDKVFIEEVNEGEKL
ncbi:MAG: transglutaminase domain-containing protein [Eubacteriales bacterium]|nr:transglutaminase domain-containing protein [Eubacteriales bacterium]